MDGAADPDQLMFAVRAGRVLLTANIRDFSLLHRAWLEAGEHHPGIVLRHQRRRDTGDQIRRLRALIASLDQDDMVDRVEFLARWA